MGGTIGVTSEPGIGSIFWIELTLPVETVESRAPAAAAQALEAPAPDGAVVTPASTLRVLVAEDNPTNQKVIAFLVKKLGWEIELAHNGAEAVEACRTAPFDLVLMDCQMPEMDGFEATRTIRSAEAAGRHIPIVAVTANAMDGDRERCLAAGMDDYVTKPLSRASLSAAVERLAQRGVLKSQFPAVA
jgi:CheY-like chemotaxis protein